MASLPAATEEGDREEQLRWLELQGATWSNREDASAAMLNFVTLVQHRHVVYDEAQSGGRCASFKCPDCKMDIRSRMRLNGDWKLVDRPKEHTNCSGRAQPWTSQLASLASVSTSVVAQRNISGEMLSLSPSFYSFSLKQLMACSRTDPPEAR